MTGTMPEPTLGVPSDRLAEFCRRWQVAELAVFGSALREDFRPDSDLDLLVTFAPDAQWSLLDRVRMEEELEGILGRQVDLVSRREILGTARVIHAEG